MSLEKGKAEALQRVIDELRDEPGALMPIMQRAQDIFGYLPEEVQQYIAKEMDMPVSDVYGVATFYAQFNLEPKGQYTISVCMGTACYVKGSRKLLDKLEEVLGITAGHTTPDGVFTLNATRCQNSACGRSCTSVPSACTGETRKTSCPMATAAACQTPSQKTDAAKS